MRSRIRFCLLTSFANFFSYLYFFVEVLTLCVIISISCWKR